VRRVTVAERRARLGVRHGLAPGAQADSPAAVTERVVAVHGTDPGSVYVGILARMAGGSLADVDRALYEDRSVVRVLAMRRTVFATTPALAAVALAGAGRAVAARERRRLLMLLRDAGVPGDLEAWVTGAEQALLAALDARGEATASELTGDDPRLAQPVVVGAGSKWSGTQNVASRLLLIMATEGQVIRGRPRGSWLSQGYRWATAHAWCPGGFAEWDHEAAEAELARCWLAAFGPAPAADLQWWAGWTKTQTRRALAAIGPAEVELEDGGPGYVLAGDEEPAPAAEPWAALLPGLDTTPMGWQDRTWFLGEHGPRLFDQTGNIGPSLWWDGRIVGGWAQAPDGEIVCRFLEDAGSEAVAAAGKAAARLTALIGDARLTARARGRTWLEKELNP
jgi:hypothetical protein